MTDSMSEQEKEKKRKRRDDSEGRPKKKAATTPHGNVSVEWVENKGELGPLLAVTPGLKFPSKIAFQPYRSIKIGAQGATSELLLQSSEHARLDYIAEQEHDGSSESQLKDYIGVFDPATNSLKVMPVKRVTVRSTLRSEIQEMREEQEAHEARQNTITAKKFALASEFGSKKSKKALESRTLNTIRTDPNNQNGAVAQTVLSNMASLTGTMPTKEELEAAVDSSKPRPVPNIAATFPGDVYTMENVVGTELMTMLDIKDWVAAADAGEGVNVPSLYVAKRMRSLARNKQIQKLKVLRFILLCINFNAALTGGGGSRAKRIPVKGKLEALMGDNVPPGCVMAIRRKFAPETGDMPRWNVDKLMTHVAAAALFVDDLEVDVNDLREDLRLENKDIKSYFAELGCRVAAPTLTEQSKLKLTKAESVNHFLAKLKLPLKFPKVGGPRKAKR